MNEQLVFLLAALVLYAVTFWLQGGNKPEEKGKGWAAALTNMGHDEMFMSSLCYMAFSAILTVLPIPGDMNNIVMRLTVFTIVGLMMQGFLLKRGAIEMPEWFMGGLLPQAIAIMVLNGIPVVTQAYVLAGQVFFGMTGGNG